MTADGWSAVWSRAIGSPHGILVAKRGEGKAAQLAEVSDSGCLILHNVEMLPAEMLRAIVADARRRGAVL